MADKDLNAEFHEKMADANARGLTYDPKAPGSLESTNARLIKEGEELMALHKTREAEAQASKSKLQLLTEKLKRLVGLG